MWRSSSYLRNFQTLAIASPVRDITRHQMGLPKTIVPPNLVTQHDHLHWYGHLGVPFSDPNIPWWQTKTPIFLGIQTWVAEQKPVILQVFSRNWIIFTPNSSWRLQHLPRIAHLPRFRASHAVKKKEDNVVWAQFRDTWVKPWKLAL